MKLLNDVKLYTIAKRIRNVSGSFLLLYIV